MCAVPLECAEQLAPPIIEPAGISIVNVMSWPDIIPEKVPRIMLLGIPEKLIEPVTLEPFWVSCQVMLPIPAWPIMPPVPSAAVVESVAVPDQVPPADVDPGETGELEPPHAAANEASSSSVLINVLDMGPYFLNS